MENPPQKDNLVVDKIYFYADKWKVSGDEMYKVIDCETGGTFDPNIQSFVKYNFSDPKRGIVKNETELSFGLSQIHLPDHDITEAQAKDPDFALNFMAEEFSKGNHWMWSCYNHIYR